MYCWAKDNALSSKGAARSNSMVQSYVHASVGSAAAPLGGTTARVWVVDATPPTMIFVSAESVNDETLQLTLQLNEPGTLWCAAAELSSSTAVPMRRSSSTVD